MKPIIGITMGDVSGIGTEIIAKALSIKEIYELCRPLVIGDAGAMEKGVAIAGVPLKVASVEAAKDAEFEYGIVAVFDLRNPEIEEVEMGRISETAGRASVEFIQRAVELALQGEIHAIATAPINKEAVNKAGYGYTGHTELLAQLTKTRDYAMMLMAGTLRVTHVTTHSSLRNALDMIRKERIVKVILLTDKALQDLGVRQPRIAVAALNPHGGEGGLFGNEETDEILPAIREAARMGIDVHGPLPADTVFVKARGGAFDAAVAMYHDQGHIPVKLVGLEWNALDEKWEAMGGVNVTIGLPIIRTSVDHGTAFGKAGKGKANPQSMVQAIKWAAKMARMRSK